MTDKAQTLLACDRFSVVRQPYQDAQGARRTRDIVRHPGAVAILPLLADDRICLIRNRRVAVGRTLIEIPAGTRDPSETPKHCAVRELAEETGYRAGSIEKVHEFFPSPGVFDELMHLFVATDLTPGAADLEVDEQIENLIVSSDDALAMVDRGEIQDAKTIVALLLHDRARR